MATTTASEAAKSGDGKPAPLPARGASGESNRSPASTKAARGSQGKPVSRRSAPESNRSPAFQRTAAGSQGKRASGRSAKSNGKSGSRRSEAKSNGKRASRRSAAGSNGKPASRQSAATGRGRPVARGSANDSSKRPRLDDLMPRAEEITLHGHRVAYRTAGSGPVLLLIHGITGSAKQWDLIVPLLAERYTVIAPDLLGHGESAKPRGDYSLGAYAAGVRDLLVALGHRRATIVGHSLGGGVAMQFAYEYPPFAERLVLVSSGGLGREVHLLLRAATLPGSELVLPLIASTRVRAIGTALGHFLGRLGLRAGSDLAEMGRGYGSLADAGARQAFLHTARAVIDPTGQRVSATDRLYLAAMLPSLVIWGRRDPLIPVAHAEIARRAIPKCRVEIFEDAGHFPQVHEPLRFAHTLIDFIESTEPTQLGYDDADFAMLRRRLLAGAP